MIKIENLNFKFDNETIFKDAVIEILNNRLTVITGTNGAGKSTLLKIITKNIRTNCKIQNAFKNIFYLPQNPYYPKDITTFDRYGLQQTSESKNGTDRYTKPEL